MSLLSSLMVASAYSKNLTWDLSKSYTDVNVGYPELDLTYDIGSAFPYDDVYTTTSVNVAAGMTGYAYAYTKALSGASNITTSTTTVGGWVTTPQAVVAGQDYATNLNFRADRTNSLGSKESWIINVD